MTKTQLIDDLLSDLRLISGWSLKLDADGELTEIGEGDPLDREAMLSADTLTLRSCRLAGGDYDSMGLLGIANARAADALFEQGGVFVCMGGEYFEYCLDLQNLVEDQAAEFRSLIELLQALEDYPVVDDDLHSQMEFDVKIEAIEEAASDICREAIGSLKLDQLASELGEVVGVELWTPDEDMLAGAYKDWSEEHGLDFAEVEQAGAYIDSERATESFVSFLRQGDWGDMIKLLEAVQALLDCKAEAPIETAFDYAASHRST